MGIDLEGGDIIFLDTAPFIYFFEQHPDHFLPSYMKQVPRRLHP